MASSLVNHNLSFYVRFGAGVSELNGAAFDPTVAGGTNYADADTPVQTGTAGTCTAGSTTFVDATATFPSDCQGNGLRISAATGGSAAAPDTYIVQSRTNATTLVLDRAPATGTNITASTWRLGGANAGLINFCDGGGLTPALAAPCSSGNKIYVRGAGTDTPSSADYTQSTYAGIVDGDLTYGPIRVIGYNGRPRFAVTGANYFSYAGITRFENLMLVANGSGIVVRNNRSKNGAPHFYNVRYDALATDGQFCDNAGVVDFCDFQNTGTLASGTVATVSMDIHGNPVRFSNFIRQMGWAVDTLGGQGMIGCVVAQCQNTTHGAYHTYAGQEMLRAELLHNTFCDNKGDDIYIADYLMAWPRVIKGNLFVRSGRYSINSQCNGKNYASNPDYNGFLSAPLNGIANGAHDITTLLVDPFVASSTFNFALNTSATGGALCLAQGLVIPDLFGATSGRLDLGAIQS